VGDTRLFVEERGTGALPLILLHGGPGLDHTTFGTALDALGDVCRLLLVDERSQGRSDPAPPETWTLEQHAADVSALAAALGLERYAVLGHSYGAMIALQHAVAHGPQDAALVGTVISSGVPSSRFLAVVEANLAAFEPVELREQVTASWAREAEARTQEDVRSLFADQLPFHFADPRDPRIADALAALSDAVYAPDVLRAAAVAEYGGIEVEERLPGVGHPVLVLAGRHDRTCTPEAAEAIAAGVPGAELVVLEASGHMGYFEENDAYVGAVRSWVGRLA
jgi:pimeloyl-ACP methyl ester carboxylesterase